MTHNFSVNKLFPSRIRFSYLLIAFSLLLFLAACRAKAPTTTPTPEVIITAYTALVTGELINIDGCLRIQNDQTHSDYALVWTPDFSVTMDGDEIRVIYGVVRNKTGEIVLHVGDTVRMSGGETMYPDEQLLQNISSNCKGPYWAVGFEIAPVQTVEVPDK